MHPVERHHENWLATRIKLSSVTAKDLSYQLLPLTNPLPIVSRLFCHYSQVVFRLDQAWQNICQPQRNLGIRKILDSAVKRLLEMRAVLTECEVSDFHYVDGVLVELKLVPSEAEVLSYHAYPLPRSKEMQEVIDAAFVPKPVIPDEDEEETPDDDYHDDDETVPLSPEEQKRLDAVLLIQSHERGRQGRLDIYDIKIRKDTVAGRIKPPKYTDEVHGDAARLVQAYWKGHKVREDMKKREGDRQRLIGMDEIHWRSTRNKDRIKDIERHAGEVREERLQEYLDAVGRERTRVLYKVRPVMVENVADEIREWFGDWYAASKNFDKYPTPEEGGTALVVRGETLSPKEHAAKMEKERKEREKIASNPALQAQIKAAALKAKIAALKEKKLEKKMKAQRLKDEKALKKKQKEMGIIVMQPSAGLNALDVAQEEYTHTWGKDDARPDRTCKPVIDIITEEEVYQLQFAVRTEVDELMRLELELLLDAVYFDKTRKKRKRPKPKKEKRKKGNKDKKGGGKKKKDALHNLNVVELMQEYVENGVIRKYDRVQLKDFFGDFSYNNGERRAMGRNPLPCVGDVRKVAMQLCVLPLGDVNLPKPKSVCIFGPRQSGKKFLAQAICSETDAMLIDLSPNVLAGKYPGKKGLKKLLARLNCLARLLQPTIFFMEGGEKPFYQKIPEEEKLNDPKRLKKALMKEIIKPIKASERIMVVATSKEPWNCTKRPFLKAFQKFIMIPRTDYNTTLLHWRVLLNRYPVLHSLPLTPLTTVSTGFPIPALREIVNKLLNGRRVMQLGQKAVTINELQEAIFKDELGPVTDEEFDKYVTWYATSIDLGKRRAKMFKAAEEKRLAAVKAEEIKKMQEMQQKK